MQNWEGGRERFGGLFVCQVGEQTCEALHQYGPAVRDHVLLHFVASGQGSFYTRGEVYPLGPGQGFAIFPDQITTYRADKLDPWRYFWVGFAGYDAEPMARQAGLSRECPVFSFGDVARVIALAGQMRRDAAELRQGALAALGGLYQMMALIAERGTPPETDPAQGYCEKALWFMRGNYSHRISIEDVADYVGLSRSQLFRVFQKGLGVSPKECLTQIRVKRALELIEGSQLTLDQVAASCGIGSGARLNALLRAAVGMSAGQYRRAREPQKKAAF